MSENLTPADLVARYNALVDATPNKRSINDLVRQVDAMANLLADTIQCLTDHVGSSWVTAHVPPPAAIRALSPREAGE
jgi:hypothetical protein